MKSKITILMVMLVLAIVAVGSVSATEDVSADVIDESADGMVVEEIATDDASLDDADDVDEIPTRSNNDQTVYSNMSSSEIDAVIETVSNNGGGTVTFATGTYYNMSLTLKNNTALVAENSVFLVGNSINHVIEVQNIENFTISGFSIDVNYIAGSNYNVTGIHGSFATNGLIYGNTIYDGFDGININKKFDNITIENNEIYAMTRDGVSFANPQNNNNYNSIIGANIINNRIRTANYGIFIGGTFKGNISDNHIRYSTCGIQFLGKPNSTAGHLIANISNNSIVSVTTGIQLFNPDVIYLNVTSNEIETYNLYTGYTIENNTDFHKSSNGYIGFFDNSLYGCIRQDFIDITDVFDNEDDGYIID